MKLYRRRKEAIWELRTLGEWSTSDYRESYEKREARQERAIQRGWRYVRWVVRRGLDLPLSGSPAAEAFAKLFVRSDTPEYLKPSLSIYMVSQLGKLTCRTDPPHSLERELPASYWIMLLRNAESIASIDALFHYINCRLCFWPLCSRAFSALVEEIDEGRLGLNQKYDDLLDKLISELATVFPAHTDVEDGPEYNSLFPRLAGLISVRTECHADWSDWLLRSFEFHLHSISRLSPALGDLAVALFDYRVCEVVLEKATSYTLCSIFAWCPALFRYLQEIAPAKVASKIYALWVDRSFARPEWKWWGWQEESSQKQVNGQRQVRDILSVVSPEVLDHLALPVGMAVGLDLAKRGLSLSAGGEVLKSFGLPTVSELPKSVSVQIRLWRELQLLAKYQQESYRRQTEILGVQARIMELVSDNPAEWAQALPWILECSQYLDGFAESATVNLVDCSTQVMEQVERLAEQGKPDLIRDIASGIRAIYRGFSNPSEVLWQDLLSFASRQLDGSSFRPEPLAAASSTWLSSYSIEVLLRSTAANAESAFHDYFTDQGGVEEEAVTSRLLSELEHAFRATQSRVKGLGKKSLFTVNLSQRQVRKREEKVYGCDIAFLVTVTSPWSKGVKTAELVQVKKPIRESPKKSFVDRWRIDAPQLSNLLKWSPGAVYWLLGVRGEVLVVPGKFLQAMNPVRRLGIQGKDFHVDYLRVRPAAIPLSQFLIDLLVGLWLGTTDEEALRFARGEASSSPRFIVEVEVDLSGERHQ